MDGVSGDAEAVPDENGIASWEAEREEDHRGGSSEDANSKVWNPIWRNVSCIAGSWVAQPGACVLEKQCPATRLPPRANAEWQEGSPCEMAVGIDPPLDVMPDQMSGGPASCVSVCSQGYFTPASRAGSTPVKY